jgi:hypothetical protein
LPAQIPGQICAGLSIFAAQFKNVIYHEPKSKDQADFA